MFNIDSKLQKVLFVYVIINIAVYYYKPSFCFDEKGNFKHFGVGEDKTIFPFWLVTLVISLMFYLYISVKTDDFV
tara:strand:+ start:2759 stop:2983 length:225 start_codon:yes stop_codon:yes gene_type:complete